MVRRERKGPNRLLRGESLSALDDKRRGPRKHPWATRRPAAPAKLIDGDKRLAAAAHALWRWPVATYPGILKGLAELFQGRVRPYTIRDWRRGKRRAPQWAIDLLLTALRERRAAIDHAIELLTKEKGRA